MEGVVLPPHPASIITASNRVTFFTAGIITFRQ
jgi:hypothetical protein